MEEAAAGLLKPAGLYWTSSTKSTILPIAPSLQRTLAPGLVLQVYDSGCSSLLRMLSSPFSASFAELLLPQVG